MKTTKRHTTEKASGKLLVISEIGIGDGLTLLPALRLLLDTYPDIGVDMMAPGLRPLAENVSDTVRLIAPPPESMTGQEDLVRLLQAYDWVWNTENEHSGWRPVIAAVGNPQWLSAPPHRHWPRRQVLELRLQHLRMLFPELSGSLDLTLNLTPRQQEHSAAFRAQFPQANYLIALHPGAKDPTKKWPAAKFAELARRLAAQPDCVVLFFLGPGEKSDFSQAPLPQLPNLRRIEEPLDTAVALLHACDTFVGNDSGFYHLAYALGLNVVGIYRSRRNMRVWSYSSHRSHAVCFYLPSQVRRYWHKFITVDKLLRAVNAFRNFSVRGRIAA